MREFDRDLIRGGHYGQRSREPHQKAGHMAAPTNAAREKVLANPEPSTHDPQRSLRHVAPSVFRLFNFPDLKFRSIADSFPVPETRSRSMSPRGTALFRAANESFY